MLRSAKNAVQLFAQKELTAPPHPCSSLQQTPAWIFDSLYPVLLVLTSPNNQAGLSQSYLLCLCTPAADARRVGNYKV